MKMRSVALAGLAAGLLGLRLCAGCATPAGGPSFAGGALPATYTGRLPCADCPGIDWTLNLYPDGVFHQRLEYLERGENGRPARFDDAGRWVMSSDGEVLVLQGGGEMPELFAVLGGDTLRKLDVEGRAIESKLHFDLKRAGLFAPFEPAPGPGVARVTAFAAAPLEGGEWSAVKIGDADVAGTDARRAPSLSFATAGGRFSGFDGCNRIGGTFTRDGATLRLGGIVATRMACPDDGGRADAFARALAATTRFRILGRTLELYGGEGPPVARLRAAGGG